MSATNRGSDYRPGAAYYTDQRVARAIVNRLPLEQGDVVLEGHAGGGSFLRALITRRERDGLELPLLAMDVDPEAPTMKVARPKYVAAVQSFLTEPVDWTSAKTGKTYRIQDAAPYPSSWAAPDWVIGNPPYGVQLDRSIRKSAIDVAEPHVWRALELTRRHVVFLLRVGFLAADGRARGLLRVHPPRGSWLLHPRPSFTGTGNDQAAYAAVWWDNQWSPAGGDPFFPSGGGWLDWKAEARAADQRAA